jgi:hypothetical protein
LEVQQNGHHPERAWSWRAASTAALLKTRRGPAIGQPSMITQLLPFQDTPSVGLSRPAKRNMSAAGMSHQVHRPGVQSFDKADHVGDMLCHQEVVADAAWGAREVDGSGGASNSKESSHGNRRMPIP